MSHYGRCTFTHGNSKGMVMVVCMTVPKQLLPNSIWSNLLVNLNWIKLVSYWVSCEGFDFITRVTRMMRCNITTWLHDLTHTKLHKFCKSKYYFGMEYLMVCKNHYACCMVITLWTGNALHKDMYIRMYSSGINILSCWSLISMYVCSYVCNLCYQRSFC